MLDRGVLGKGMLSMFLWLAIMATSFLIVKSSHQYRMAFIDWQGMLEQEQKYQVEWGQLLLEKSTLASFLGLETIAKDELNMTFPSRKQIVVVENNAEDNAGNDHKGNLQ